MKPDPGTGKILLTGFGPFPGVPVNASAILVEKLKALAAARFPRHEIVTAILPAEWQAAPVRLAHLAGEHRPMLSLHFGVSASARGFEIETRGRNVRGEKPDAANEVASSGVILADGPSEIATSLPVQKIVERLQRENIPAFASDDAGRYLCNAVLYQSLTQCMTRAPAALAGFIHIPTGLAGLGSETGEPLAGCPLRWQDAIEGSLIIIEQCLAAMPQDAIA